MNRLKDYLTLYHEYRIPKNEFFDIKSNQVKNSNLLVVSSPSRMGNHLLMSLLDSHPELPRVPGEDGFLFHSFVAANYDIHEFVKNTHSNNLDYIEKISTNFGEKKWETYNNYFHKGHNDKVVAGVGVKEHSAIVDFKDFVTEINYKSFISQLEKPKEFENYNSLLLNYIKAYNNLDYQKQKSKYSHYLVFGGMRTQLDWICQTFSKTKILASIREFDTYAVSMLRSKFGKKVINEDMIQLAWEHWYHKVIDLLYLKENFPDKIALVKYEDLLTNLQETTNRICNFLNIEYSDTMLTTSIFGKPVVGNSSSKNHKSKAGNIYSSTERLDSKYLNEDYKFLINQLTQLAL